LGDGKVHGDDPEWDAFEAEQLYGILEKEIIPEFYNRNEKGIPVAWISRMRESMSQLTPRFSADRTVREYTEQHYLPAAAAYLERAADKSTKGKQIIEWQNTLDQKWNTIRFGDISCYPLDEKSHFDVQVYFNDVDPDAVAVELYADAIKDEPMVLLKMTRGAKLEGAGNGYNYNLSVASTRPDMDFTARIIPSFPNVSVPLENSHILWQR